MKNALGWLVLVMTVTNLKIIGAETSPSWVHWSLSGTWVLWFEADTAVTHSREEYRSFTFSYGPNAYCYRDFYRPNADGNGNPESGVYDVTWSGAAWPWSGTPTGTTCFTNGCVDDPYGLPTSWYGCVNPFFGPNEQCSTFDFIDYLGNTNITGYGTLQRDVTTSWKLWTGGEAGSSRIGFFRLFTLGYDILNLSNIPNSHISVEGHPVDTDDYAWLAAADDQFIACTPQASGYANYSYNLSPKKARLGIYGTGGSGDLADKTNTVVVGQQISLECRFDDTEHFPTTIITNFSWTVPGTTVANYITTLTNGVVVTNRYPEDYTNSVMNFHWIDGSGSSLFEVECTAIAKGVTLTAKTKFKVIRPTASLGAEMPGTIGIGPDGTGTPWLIFGLLLNTNPGVIFRGSNMAPSEVATNGHWFFAQTGATTI